METRLKGLHNRNVVCEEEIRELKGEIEHLKNLQDFSAGQLASLLHLVTSLYKKVEKHEMVVLAEAGIDRDTVLSELLYREEQSSSKPTKGPFMPFANYDRKRDPKTGQFLPGKP
jgi:hypothetical protein